jgi:hypothetical protein
MEPITQFSQLDLSKTYTYADYLTWKFDEFVELIKGKVMLPMARPNRRHQQLSNRLERPIANFYTAAVARCTTRLSTCA